jgi:hypothetical protein
LSADVLGSRSDRALVALVAVFVPSRAPSLLSRFGGPESEVLLSAGTELASLPRRERLLALGAALEELQPSTAAMSAALANAERPRTRELLARPRSAVADPPGNPLRPALTRLLEEAMAEPRPAVRSPSPPRPGSARSLAPRRRHAP